jgi:uncharacterized DUF497 family protein
MRFVWDSAKAANNVQRHNVTFEEAITAFFDPNALDTWDAEHSDDEDRFYLIGLSERRLLFVVYAEPEEGTIRIISARRAEGKYRRLYEQQN